MRKFRLFFCYFKVKTQRSLYQINYTEAAHVNILFVYRLFVVIFSSSCFPFLVYFFFFPPSSGKTPACSGPASLGCEVNGHMVIACKIMSTPPPPNALAGMKHIESLLPINGLLCHLYRNQDCGVCSEGYGRGSANSCHKCTREFKGVMYFVLAVVTLLAIVVIALLATYLVWRPKALPYRRRNVIALSIAPPNAFVV